MIAALSSVAGVSSSLAGAGEAGVNSSLRATSLTGGQAGTSGPQGLSLSSEPAAEAAGSLESAAGIEGAGLQGTGGVQGSGGLPEASGVPGAGGEGAAGLAGAGANEGAGVGSGSGGFGEALTSAISSLEQTQQKASGAAQALATGGVSDPEAAVVTVEEAQLAMQLASQIRAKATEAVQQVFQTQV